MLGGLSTFNCNLQLSFCSALVADPIDKRQPAWKTSGESWTHWSGTCVTRQRPVIKGTGQVASPPTLPSFPFPLSFSSTNLTPPIRNRHRRHPRVCHSQQTASKRPCSSIAIKQLVSRFPSRAHTHTHSGKGYVPPCPNDPAPAWISEIIRPGKGWRPEQIDKTQPLSWLYNQRGAGHASGCPSDCPADGKSTYHARFDEEPGYGDTKSGNL
jgi:hypothetical protein